MSLYDEDDLPYLTGAAFSNGRGFPLQRRFHGAGRIDLLCGLARDRSLLHVGCADHAELIPAKRERGTWLHGRLVEVARVCAGVDVSGANLEAVRALGVDDVWQGDLARGLPEGLAGRRFDLTVLGEIVEHLDDPVAFLAGLRAHLGAAAGTLVVTVPNAFAWNNFVAALRGQERINTDHRFWFTPFTLGRVLAAAGWQLADAWSVDTNDRPERHSRRARLRAAVYGRFPQFAPTLVVTARPVP